MNAIFLELEYDEDSFAKFFEYQNHNQFKVDGQALPKKKGEHQLQSVKVQQTQFMESIIDGIAALETHLKKQFKSPDLSFDFLVHERTGLIYQLRVHDELDEGVQMELWCVTDLPD